MKKVFILHRWSGVPESDWYPWLGAELEKGNEPFEVVVPEMPNTDTPIIEERVEFLKNLVGIPDENTFFIAHSIGAQTVMHFFETLPEDAKVGGAIFVAGWFNLGGIILEEGDDVQALAKPWTETPIDFGKVKSVCPNISVFLSSDEPYDYLAENKKIFEEKLGAKVTILENRGHFTEDDGVKEIPEVLAEFLEMAK